MVAHRLVPYSSQVHVREIGWSPLFHRWHPLPCTPSNKFHDLSLSRLWQCFQSASHTRLLSLAGSLLLIRHFASLDWEWAFQMSPCFLPCPPLACHLVSGTLCSVPSAVSQPCSIPRQVWKLSVGQALDSPVTEERKTNIDVETRPQRRQNIHRIHDPPGQAAQVENATDSSAKGVILSKRIDLLKPLFLNSKKHVMVTHLPPNSFLQILNEMGIN